MNTKTFQHSFMLRAYVFIAAWLASVCPAFATDLFASGKTTVTNTVGSGSSGEFYILVAGLIGGIIGFFVGVVFWEVGKSFVGL